MNVSDLQTPALLLDKPAMERNMEKIDALRQGTSMALYPHYKSHKCPAIAKLQLARGAWGITCAKLSEALDLAQAGVKNIVIANQVVQAEKLPVLARLARQCVLTVCADDARNVLALEQAMAPGGGLLRVLVEYDVGMRRCGVQSYEEALALAELIEDQPHLAFEGIQAYAGHLAHQADAEKRRRELLAIEQDVAGLKDFIQQAGFPVTEVCGGSTGTAADKPKNTVYTQLQCGSYLFMDTSYQALELNLEQALTVLTTVLSVRPDHIVVDCGVKSMSMDQRPPVFPDFPSAALDFSEEHTTLFVKDTGLQPGDRLRYVPGHCCTTINSFSSIHLTENGQVLDSFPIVSRGKAQ